MNRIDESYLPPDHDLVTPDGTITHLKKIDDSTATATVFAENISANFKGFEIEPELVFFNIKSTLAQVGIEGIGEEYELNKRTRSAQINIRLRAYGSIGQEMLNYLQTGAVVGKLFAADPRRRVRDPDYLSRMFGRSDRWGRPLLSLGGLHGSSDLILDVIDGRAVAYLTLRNGRVIYNDSIRCFLPTLGKALTSGDNVRNLLRLHQEWKPLMPRNIQEEDILLVKTLPLHIRTVFARVVNDLLSEGYTHTSASILQPDTTASGDIYELFGQSKRELTDIPLEFYTLEPYQEYVFFQDRDQLQASLDDPQALFKAFATAPLPVENKAAVFIVKGTQLNNLKEENWTVRAPRQFQLPGHGHGERQAMMVERYIKQQTSYPYLKEIDEGRITSQGILLSRHFPSPFMKRMLLSDQVQRGLKGIYFQNPSLECENFFSSEDRALLHDLANFGIPVYWVDEATGKILQFAQKAGYDSGLFVPLDKVEMFLKSTVLGIYGSNLLEGEFEIQIKILLQGLLDMRSEMNHSLLKANTPLSLITGGGPGAMEVGNRVAKDLGILSCANIVDFRQKGGQVVNEQLQNPYVEAKMTYRLDKLVERQAEFNLDFPIFLTGGIGTDFEYCLEEVRRKVGSVKATPILLFGSEEYWRDKITSRFQRNDMSGTIKGSEWISNTLYCIQTGEQGLSVYRQYFSDTLPIGKNHPPIEQGFVLVKP